MQILHIAGYQFIEINHLEELRQTYLEKCQSLLLKGTILLSKEGLNINLAGLKDHIKTFMFDLKKDARFINIRFHESYATINPFRRLKIKLKKEIISFREPKIDPVHSRAPSISPATLKQWLDENRDITLLDTRNTYEINFGTFSNAIHLNLSDFCEFPLLSSHINSQKPIVMFCTGGIRCEKAALYLMSKGINQVYQLDGGILGYFSHVGGHHYRGECFVFDDRVSVDYHLNQTGTAQCKQCQRPIAKAQQTLPPNNTLDVICPACP